MGGRDAATCDDEVGRTFARHETTPGYVVMLAGRKLYHRGAVRARLVDVDGVTALRDHILELPIRQQVFGSQRIKPDDMTRFAHTDLARQLNEVRVLETRKVFTEKRDAFLV